MTPEEHAVAAIKEMPHIPWFILYDTREEIRDIIARHIRTALAEAVAERTEACAKIADDHAASYMGGCADGMALRIADDIRALDQQPKEATP